jgi:ribosomal protein S13
MNVKELKLLSEWLSSKLNILDSTQSVNKLSETEFSELNLSKAILKYLKSSVDSDIDSHATNNINRYNQYQQYFSYHKSTQQHSVQICTECKSKFPLATECGHIKKV